MTTEEEEEEEEQEETENKGLWVCLKLLNKDELLVKELIFLVVVDLIDGDRLGRRHWET